MNLYEVIFDGAVGTDDDSDTIYLVRAPDYLAAIDVMSHSLSRDHHSSDNWPPTPDVVYELGIDNSRGSSDEPLYLRGPYVQPSYNYGWRKWERKIDWETGRRSTEWEEVKN